MTETNMPAAEAASTDEREVISYEFAFHVLPTVAEGEVASVVETLKSLITTAGGELFDEETPQRFDLAYEIEKYIDGKYRRFHSAYFGWLRFRLESAALEALTKEIDGHKQLLRYLIIRLTKVEEEHPFRFHEALETKRVTTVEEQEVVADDLTDTEVNESEVEKTDEATEDTASEVSATDDEAEKKE